MAAAAVPAAIVGGSIISGVIGAHAQESAASKAAKAQENAANQANATQNKFFNTTQENLKPFINAGDLATSKIQQLEGLSPEGAGGIQSTLEQLPGYQFALRQGLKSVQNSATARGLGVSGAAQKGAADFATGTANEYYNNLLSGLQNTQEVGANAAGGLATAATNTGASIGSNIIGAGNAAGGADIARGNAISGAATGVGNGLISSALLQNFQQNNAGTSYLNPADSGNLALDSSSPYNSFVNGSYGASGSNAWGANSLWTPTITDDFG
jgi:hypothetical protein